MATELKLKFNKMMRWDIINHLIKKNEYKTYLEVGYFTGWSFDQVDCEYKTAVDPNPCKDDFQRTFEVGGIMKYPPHVIYKTTSDDFFDKMSLPHKVVKQELTWDIIFIDGDHRAEQVTKDIQNSLKFLSSGGTIVLHDCNPPKYEHTTTGIDGCWTGDVYKAVIWFRSDYEEEYEFICVDVDWGVGIIQKRPILKPETGRSLEQIMESSGVSDWDFFNGSRNEILNLISYPDFIRMIKDVKPSNQANEAIKDHYSATK